VKVWKPSCGWVAPASVDVEGSSWDAWYLPVVADAEKGLGTFIIDRLANHWAKRPRKRGAVVWAVWERTLKVSDWAAMGVGAEPEWSSTAASRW
jgi:hypothetical protein